MISGVFGLIFSLQLSLVAFQPRQVAKMGQSKLEARVALPPSVVLAWLPPLVVAFASLVCSFGVTASPPKRVCIPCPGGQTESSGRVYQLIVNQEDRERVGTFFVPWHEKGRCTTQ